MFIQRATSNTTADDLLASLVATFSDSGQDIRQISIDTIRLVMQKCLPKLAFSGHQRGVSVAAYLASAEDVAREMLPRVIHSISRGLQIFFRKLALWSCQVGGILVPYVTNTKEAAREILRKAFDLAFQVLRTYLQLTISGNLRAMALLWRVLKFPEILHFLLRMLTSCGIASAKLVGIMIVAKIGIWALLKIWKICKRAFQRFIEIQMEKYEKRRHEDYVRRLRINQATEAVAREEARLQRAREELAKENKRKRDEEQKRARARADYETWDKKCDILFRTKSSMASMTKFPFPPLPQCTDPKNDCPNYRKTPIAACEHNVKQFFRGSGMDLLTIVQRHRIYCHEDKFASCSAALRPEFIRLATSLFVVLDPWYKELKSKQANSSSARKSAGDG